MPVMTSTGTRGKGHEARAWRIDSGRARHCGAHPRAIPGFFFQGLGLDIGPPSRVARPHIVIDVLCGRVNHNDSGNLPRVLVGEDTVI